MRKASARNVALQLIEAYEEEDRLYARLQAAAVEQHVILRNGRDPRRLAALLERQRRLAERIGQIESGIVPLREYWENIRDTEEPAVQVLAQTLDDLLERLANRIHAIIELERADSRVLLGELSASEG